MKKALHNLIFNGKKFEQGQVYSDEDVQGADVDSFEEVVEKVEVKEKEIEVTKPELDSEIS